MLRILHVEDNELYSAAVQLVLTAEGVAVESVRTLAEAEKRLRDSLLPSFDVLLVDLGLPDAGELEAVTVLHAYNVPIVVLSVISERDTLERAAAAGADDYIIKGPIDSVAFLRRIRFACRRYVKQTQTVASAVSASHHPKRSKIKPQTLEALKPFISCGMLGSC